MKFYDRDEELKVLEKAYLTAGKGGTMVVINGRRRVGKSRLMDEFLKGKKAISIQLVPKEEKQLVTDIVNEIKTKYGYAPPLNTFKEVFEYIFQSKDITLVSMDEFPAVLTINKAIPYELQVLWDKYRESKDIVLLISGSYVGMMNKIFTAQKAPLFNRAFFTIRLQQLPFRVVTKILSDLGIKDSSKQLSYYCVFGGVPYYYVLLERSDNKVFEQAITNLFFEQAAQLREEGQDILRQEFGNAYPKYYAILEAIHAGFVSMSEISNRLGVRSNTLTKYIDSLQKDFRLIERTVPFDQNPYRSKKGLYLIRDNTIAFWFRHAYGKRVPPAKEELNAFLGRRFELLCSEFLVAWLEKKGERVTKSGRWWGNVEVEKGKFEQREIDLIIATDKALYICECKWSDNKIGEKELEHLKVSAKALKTKKPIKWVLFNKKGFTIKESKDVLLFDAGRIVRGD
ncbi:MAG: ATP-binding protein [Candidatus Micrarchaeia archaeon]